MFDYDYDDHDHHDNHDDYNSNDSLKSCCHYPFLRAGDHGDDHGGHDDHGG